MSSAAAEFDLISADRVDPVFVARYARDDWVLAKLQTYARSGDDAFTTHRWLSEDLAKRAVFASLYRDLFETQGLRVLDVGGGFSALARALASRHELHVVELCAHDESRRVTEFLQSVDGRCVLHDRDWFDLPELGVFDVVIANDLFPNVDQRLHAFLQHMRPAARRLALSLTCYDSPRFYRTRRVDGDEILTMLAWDPSRTMQVLSSMICDEDAALAEAMRMDAHSAFANGRQVCIVHCRSVRVGIDPHSLGNEASTENIS